MFRLLHTADWHLGKQLHGQALLEDQAYVLEQFHDVVREFKPDCIVIAGDIYDRTLPTTEAGCLFSETLERLALDYGKPVIIIAGNHDSPDRLEFGAKIFAENGIYIYGNLRDKIEPLIIEGGDMAVAFCPIPYFEPALLRDKLGQAESCTHQTVLQRICAIYRQRLSPENHSVLIAHAFVEGGIESDSERPLLIGGAGSVESKIFEGFSYVALGHLHAPQCAGGSNICYSGSITKLSFSEADHTKAFNLVEIDRAGAAHIEQVPIKLKREVRRLRGCFEEILNQAEEYTGRRDYLMITLDDGAPVFDALARLREVYPNVLHIERSRLEIGDQAPPVSHDDLKLDDSSLFKVFFKYVTDQELSPEQNSHFVDLLNRMKHSERQG